MTENNTGKNSIFPQNLAKALDIKCPIRAKFAASQPRHAQIIAGHTQIYSKQSHAQGQEYRPCAFFIFCKKPGFSDWA